MNARRAEGEPSVAQAMDLIMIPFGDTVSIPVLAGTPRVSCALIDCLIRTSCTIAIAGHERSSALPVSGNLVDLWRLDHLHELLAPAGNEWMGNFGCWRPASKRPSSGGLSVETGGPNADGRRQALR